MKLTKMALAAAIATALFGSAAFAQQQSVVTNAPNGAYDYYTQEAASPSDVAPAAQEPAQPQIPPSGNTFYEEVAEEEAEEPKDYFTLQGMFDDGAGGNLLGDRNLLIGGSIAQSFTANFDNPHSRFNGPVTWTDRSNDYQLNQAWLYQEKKTDTSDRDFDWGGRVDGFYGTNARWSIAQGLEDKLNPNYDFYGVALPNLYGTLAYRDLTVKLGHFTSPVGYFTIDTTANFFNTIPYTYQYGEPFTHTGMWADQKVNDNFTFGGGFTRGWDNWDGGRGTPQGSPNLGAFLISTIRSDGGSSLAWFGHWSNELNQSGTYSSRYIQSLVATFKLSENITFVQQSDLGSQQAALATGQSAQWYGLNSYLFLTLTDKVTWGTNFEWFRDDDGFRVGTVLPPSTAYSFRGAQLAGNFAGDFYQVTTGPRINIKDNLILRPNLRFDWYTGLDKGAGFRPYVDGNMNQQVLLGTDLLWLF